MKYEYMEGVRADASVLPVSEVFLLLYAFPKMQKFLYMILYDQVRISRK